MIIFLQSSPLNLSQDLTAIYSRCIRVSHFYVQLNSRFAEASWHKLVTKTDSNWFLVYTLFICTYLSFASSGKSCVKLRLLQIYCDMEGEMIIFLQLLPLNLSQDLTAIYSRFIRVSHFCVQLNSRFAEASWHKLVTKNR